jgi:hypothetical protein
VIFLFKTEVWASMVAGDNEKKREKMDKNKKSFRKLAII